MAHEWFDHFPQNEFGCGELLSLTHPDLIRECHCQLIGGGADAVVTNTFGATSLIMKEYGAEEKVQEANRASARFALEACAQTGAKVGAVGSLGPTTTLLTLSQIPVSVVEQAYFEQALALFEGGIRVFYIEGCQDPLNGCAALTALTRLEDRVATPVQKAVTARVVDNGQMLFGTSLDDFWEVVRPFSPQALGAIGRFDDVRDAIRSLSTLPEARLAAMVDIFAVCFPEGWIESPESLRNPFEMTMTYGSWALASSLNQTTFAHLWNSGMK
ncbi:MAG TPA: homocysteine S-methyltransferase family protein [Candidatus Sulfotelmatobacter sp.]|jgi:5-methyltetrahydrofolate--homocysteine methyltransferase|nr:homocysteine S-methyltransferase family protein [Candidatus Sulfotelmatobacter sp.]